MTTLRRAAPALLLLALVAGFPLRASARLGPSGFDAWLLRGDPAAAAVRFRADAAHDPSDPWPLLGEAMLAERSLDEHAEAGALLALVAGAPRHPLAEGAPRERERGGLGQTRTPRMRFWPKAMLSTRATTLITIEARNAAQMTSSEKALIGQP